MATSLNGTRFIRNVLTNEVRPSVYSVAMPYIHSSGQYRFPSGAFSFFQHIDQTLVVGTPTTLVAILANHFAALAGIRVAFNSTTDHVIVELSNGFDMFKVNDGFLGRLDMVFTPQLLAPSAVERGIQLLQPAGVAARVVATAWGYYIPV